MIGIFLFFFFKIVFYSFIHLHLASTLILGALATFHVFVHHLEAILLSQFTYWHHFESQSETGEPRDNSDTRKTRETPSVTHAENKTGDPGAVTWQCFDCNAFSHMNSNERIPLCFVSKII